MSVEKILAHKDKLEALKAEKEAAQGALNTYMEQLKEAFDCDSIDDAGDLLTTMRANLAMGEEKLEKAVLAFSETYHSLLNEGEEL